MSNDLKDKLKSQQARINSLTADNEKLKAHLASLQERHYKQNKPARDLYESLTVSVGDMVVGTDSLGLPIAGKVSWVGMGGGLYKNQQLLKVNNSPPYPSCRFKVISQTNLLTKLSNWFKELL